MPAKKSTAVINPNFGLYLNTTSLATPLQAIVDGLNFRVKEGALTNLNIGWARFAPLVELNGPVKLIANFFLRDGTERLIFGTPTDLYRYDSATKTVSYITPHYVTGTVAVSAANPAVVTGSGSLWTANVSPGDQISFGSANTTSVSAVWYTIGVVNSDTQLTLTGPVTGAPIAGGTAYTVRKIFTGDYLTRWDEVTFLNDGDSGNDLWIATNGVDPIVSWDGNASAVVDAGLDFTCKALAVYSNMVIYGNLVQAGENLSTSFINSDVGRPLFTTGGLSEQFVVQSGTDGIREMMALGDNLVIYCELTGVLAQFVGDPIIFIFRKAFSGLGPLSGDLIADYGSYHEFLGKDSQYKFDGGVVTEVNMHVWREIISSRDPTREAMGFAHFDNENADLIWCLPLQTDDGAGQGPTNNVPPVIAHSEHYLEEVPQGAPFPYSRRSFPFTTSGYYSQQEGLTWASATDTWATVDFRWNEQLTFTAFPLNLVGSSDGKIYTINSGSTGDGVALPSFVHFGRRVMGDGRMRGLLARVYPMVRSEIGGEGSVRVRAFLSDFPSGVSVEGSDQVYSLAQDTRGLAYGENFVAPYRRARFYEIEFASDGTNENDIWAVEGYDIDIRPGGKR